MNRTISLGRHFLDNLEIYLTFAGLAVIFIVPALFGYNDYWRVLAIAAIAVGVVHGFLFWGIRRRQRKVRRELIAATREMLTDRIRNQLQILVIAATEDKNDASLAHAEAAMDASNEIVKTLDHLSLDSLQRWTQRYEAVTLSYPR